MIVSPSMVLLVTFVSFIISALLIPLIIHYCEIRGMYDRVNDRKIHNGNISRLGGLAIFLGFLLPYSYILFKNYTVTFNPYIYTSAMMLAFLTGFADDCFHVRARYKLVLQIVCGLLVAMSGLQIQKITVLSGFDIPFGPMSYVFTVCWVVVFMNAVNLLDGMDGLASGIVFIVTLFIFIISIYHGNAASAVMSALLAGAIVGFYVYNFPPAKIFMGDGGAYFLGFMYATLSLMGLKKASVMTLFLIPLVLLLVPLMDILNVIRKRVQNGYHIFIADKNHIHHRMLNVGFSHVGILGVLYAYTVVLGVSSLLMLHLAPQHSLVLFVIISMLTLISFFVLGTAEKTIENLESMSENKTDESKVVAIPLDKNGKKATPRGSTRG